MKLDFTWTWSVNGFGFGLWRNRWDVRHVIWTLAIGPITIHANVWKKREAV